ncbi:MAG: hypothetical protein GF398_18045 [Chitinivibrionales bacterium]|nr:hypothetical protein [Chitinivibrionales bacterium]
MLLRELKHRHVAYISPYHKSPWSIARMVGLQQAAGDFSTIHQCTYDQEGNIHRDHFEPSHAACNIAPLQGNYREWRKDIAQYFAKAIDPYFDFHLPERILPWAHHQHAIRPLFEQALHHQQITAWVCANDLLALWALAFLDEKGFQIPNNISVIGFDDSTDALRKGLTSYNFNMRALVNQMLEYLINRRTISPRKQRIEIEGMMIERATTAAPR